MARTLRYLRLQGILCSEQFEERLCLSAVAFLLHDMNTDIAVGASVYAADVDGDSDLDLLSASTFFENSKIAWYENTDGKGTFGEQQVISTALSSASSVYAADIDGDGDVDVLSSSHANGKLVWYENTNGKGLFGQENEIDRAAGFTTLIFAALDVDGDGDVDVLSSSLIGSEISWYENIDGGHFSVRHVVPTGEIVSFAAPPYAADIDGDGDVDVLGELRSEDGIVAWYENEDGNGNFGDPKAITTDLSDVSSVFASDMDSDGDMDVLASPIMDDKATWYENLDGNGNFGEPQDIAAEQPYSVYTADVDGDGDQDVLLGSSPSGGIGRISWYENLDGDGNLGPETVISAAAPGVSSYAADIDMDGDVDVFSAGDGRIVGYESRPLGDANNDGVFDQLDIVQVLQSNKYLSDELADATEGDWNGDGVFDQLDIVAALQADNYRSSCRGDCGGR